MRQFEFSPDLATHHAVIDGQLSVLVKLVNDAGVATATIDSFIRQTEQLLDYARYHFETEEHLMSSWAYANAQPLAARLHLSEHRSFMTRATAMRAEFMSAPRQITGQQLVRFLRDWLVHHIGESDHELAVFLRANELVAPASLEGLACAQPQ